MDCPICLMKVEKTQEHELSCGHMFHKECISQWVRDNMNCPMCRKVSRMENLIYYPQDSTNVEYSIDETWTTKISDIEFGGLVFKKPCQQLINQCPQGYINAHRCGNQALGCVYNLTSSNGKRVKIDYFLRQLILFYRVDVTKIVTISEYSDRYFSSEQRIESNYYTVEKGIYTYFAEFIFERMKGKLGKKYQVYYSKNANSLIMDLVTITMKGLTRESNANPLLITSIHSIVKLLEGKTISNESMSEYASCKPIELQSMIEEQKTFCSQVTLL
uniref:RING-type domain-containing protein n=1 Tax=Mimiviridae sp. ChoanoV1 TaxID=2596887 RepID=A0A5B8IQD1_9VIRU|nr:hypothetical protein 7_39 [Mimiviridae sp. ChoanoV1]